MARSFLTEGLSHPQSLLAEALQATQRAIIICSLNGIILFCTEPAERCLERYFEDVPAESATCRELPEPLQAWVCPPESAGAGHGSAPPARPPMIVDREPGRLMVFLLPSQNDGHRLLMLEDCDFKTSSLRLRRWLGLTVREAEVLFWVAQGKMNAGIAILLGLRTATVEKHLEHILAKLKVENRTTAACCAHEALNGYPDGRTVLAMVGPVQKQLPAAVNQEFFSPPPKESLPGQFRTLIQPSSAVTIQ